MSIERLKRKESPSPEPRLPGGLRGIIAAEEGMSVSTAIILLILVAIVVVITLDSMSVYSTWQNVNTVTTDATRLAKQDYNEYRQENRIATVAADYCEANGVSFVSAKKNPPAGHNWEITCARNADTIVFKSLPVFKDLVYQEATKDTDEV